MLNRKSDKNYNLYTLNEKVYNNYGFILLTISMLIKQKILNRLHTTDIIIKSLYRDFLHTEIKLLKYNDKIWEICMFFFLHSQ